MVIRWKVLGIAFLLSFALWYSLSGSEKVESQFEVRVDYRGIPANLVVREGMINKINIRIRASEGQLRSMLGRSYNFALDLSQLQKGENVLPISIAQLPFHRGIEVIDITPPQITIIADSINTKTVPLTITYPTKSKFDQVIEAELSPQEVTISGPSELLDEIKKLNLALTSTEEYSLGTSTFTQAIPVPAGVTATPQEAAITVTASLNRKLVTITRPIILPALAAGFITAKPQKVSIQAMVPESLVNGIKDNTAITAAIDLEEYQKGTYILPVQVTLPEGAELIKVEPRTITVNIQDKRTVNSRRQ